MCRRAACNWADCDGSKCAPQESVAEQLQDQVNEAARAAREFTRVRAARARLLPSAGEFTRVREAQHRRLTFYWDDGQ